VLQLSLQTTDRRIASKLGREMSVECDRMLDTHDVKDLSPRDLAIWAKQIFADKLARLTHQNMVVRTSANGPNAADNLLWDQATARAWNLIEAQGINAVWPAHADCEASPLSPAEVDTAKRMLAVLTETMKSPDKAASLRSSFEGTTGQSATAAQQVVQLMQTYIQAMAHAHRSVSDLEEGRAAGLRDMLDATRCEMIALENTTFREQGVVQSDVQDDNFVLTAAISTASDRHEPLHQVSAATSPTPDPAMMAVVARLMDDKRADNLRVATVTQYGSCIELFTKVTGITDVRDVTQTTASAFRDGLRRISCSYGKSQADKGLSYNELLHKEKKRDRDKRAVFRAEELEKVFQHTIWTGHANATRRHKVGTEITKDGQYWCPLIASVTGARLEEIAALTVSDIGTEDGIPYFIFDENEIRDVKTEASRRRIPIHSALISLGLMKHVDEMKRRKSSALFPDLAPRAGTKTKYGKRLGYNWRFSLAFALDGNQRELCFHSIRHFVNKSIRDMHDVPRLVRLNIVGQEPTDTNDRVYAEETELPVMQNVIERLPVCWSQFASK
jgi:integrase